jgi:hypothetical protein
MGIELQIALFLFSTAYQISASNKMKRKQAEAADARKGSSITVKNSAISLPVVYGRQEISGVQYDHQNSANYSYTAPESGTTTFDSGNDYPLYNTGSGFITPTWLDTILGANAYSGADKGKLASSVTGTKNEFMFAKHVLCHSGIESVRYATVNDVSFNAQKYKKGQRLVTYTEGGPSNLLQANGYSASELFSGVAYVAEVFRLDRDKQNYAGAPNATFLVEGMKVYTVEENAGVYTVSAEKTYSNNPAYVLMDYLTNNSYGRGLGFSEVDLEAFYNAAQVCDTVVISNAQISGHVLGSKPISSYPTFGDFPSPNDWGFEDILLKSEDNGSYYAWEILSEQSDGVTGQFYIVTLPTRDIKLYECNLTLNTEATLRDNIERILTTMNYAELVWDTNGKYKLLLDYPADDAATEALVTQTFDKDNILMDTFSIKFPSAVDRFNQVTINFINEHEDFQEDTVTWPSKTSSVHTTFLSEDGGQPLESSLSPDISNPYNALAKAEQVVRSSRSLYNISFKTTPDGLTLEPGDFISVVLSEMGITVPTVFRVEEIEINGDFTCSVSAYLFDADVLAWNVADGITYKNRVTYDYSVSAPSNITVSQGGLKVQDTAKIEWAFDQDESGSNYVYEVYYKVSTDTDYELLGTTANKYFLAQEIADLGTGATYDFGVRSRSLIGSRSQLSTITGVTILAGPNEILSITVTDDLYLTNNASGIKSRALVSWSPDSAGILPASYKVEYKITSDPTYTIFGTTTTSSALVPDISTGNYTFRITPSSIYGYIGDPLTQSKIISGLETPPSAPTGFAGNINEGQINLSWNLPTDLDVVYGGSSEIRFHNNTGGSATWDTASIIVQNLSGNTNNKTVPTLQGTFFIKFKDSSGVYSINAAIFISSFQDSSYNQVELLDEDSLGFTGTKTRCTVDTGALVLNAGEIDMEYEFSNFVDLNEVTTVRVSPYVDASVANNTVSVSAYNNVSLVSSFAGPASFASLLVYISTTQDDPTGTPTWSTFDLLTIGSFSCRAMRFKFIGITTETTTTINVTNLGVIIDKRDIIKKGGSTSSNTTNTTVTFPVSFYGGTGGTNTPTIGLQVIGGVQGDEIVITSRDKAGFSYSIFNSAVRVSRSVDWQAIGQ